ncbi:histamine H2 receptor-like [Montipora capricornis]|uniref:histamine H2 receptor-like n=1 Tax=Montipora capricornis TaxID=246305 RepID=UPI0035F18BDE
MSTEEARELQNRHIAVVATETATFSLVMILSLLGNLLVCYAVYRNPRLRCPSNYYIISLALTDILQASCSMPLSVAFLATGEWSFGAATCGFVAITYISLTKASSFNMVLMAINRYYKVVKPTKYQTIFKPRCIVISAFLAWAIPFTLAFLSIFFLDQKSKPNAGFAMCIIGFRPSFFSVILALRYASYFVIGFSYWKIYKQVKMHNANVSWQSSNIADVKITKTLFTTVIGFFSFFVPAHVIFTVSKFVEYSHFPRYLSLLSTLFIYITSCINPFIYGYMNRAFKTEFKKCFLPRRPLGNECIGEEEDKRE